MINPFQTLVPLGVLLASFAGSLHCVGMCGGLITVAAPNRQAVLFYHLGRLLGYLTLGSIAGFLGEKVLASSLHGVIPWVAASGLALTFFYLGIRAWKGETHLFQMPKSFMKLYSKLWEKIFKKNSSEKKPHPYFQAGSVGLLSVFLPCGWLYGFVLGALATQNPLYGAAFLFTFWLGTLPAMSIAPLFIRKILSPLTQRAPRFSAILLMSLGLFTLGFKLYPLLVTPKDSAPTCHHEMAVSDR